jgi:hypothetical protein
VVPALRHKGIDTALIAAGVERFRFLDAAGCVLAGDARYCGRHGFKQLAGLTPPEEPAGHFMIWRSARPGRQASFHSIPSSTAHRKKAKRRPVDPALRPAGRRRDFCSEGGSCERPSGPFHASRHAFRGCSEGLAIRSSSRTSRNHSTSDHLLSLVEHIWNLGAFCLFGKG